MSVTVLLGGCAFVVPATVSTDGQQSNGGKSAGPALSFTGRFVAFNSDALNLVPGDLNSSRDVFVHDRATGVTTRVSVANDGSQANGASAEVARPAISGNGQFVAFHSAATNLVPGDTNAVADIVLRDLWTTPPSS